MTKKLRWFTPIVKYDGYDVFRVSSLAFKLDVSNIQLVSDSELSSIPELQKLVDIEWAKISPHDPPTVIGADFGRLILYDEYKD